MLYWLNILQNLNEIDSVQFYSSCFFLFLSSVLLFFDYFCLMYRRRTIEEFSQRWIFFMNNLESILASKRTFQQNLSFLCAHFWRDMKPKSLLISKTQRQKYPKYYQKIGQIPVCCMRNTSNMFLAQCWSLETRFIPFLNLIKMTI